jgi:hypothetical protein
MTDTSDYPADDAGAVTFICDTCDDDICEQCTGCSCPESMCTSATNHYA